MEPAPRPAARYEKHGALVVEDGRGDFVVVIEAEDAVLVGLNAVLREVRNGEVVVDVAGVHGVVLRRPLPPLTVYSGKKTSRSDLARSSMTTAEVAEILRRVRPPELDVEDLLQRVRAD